MIYIASPYSSALPLLVEERYRAVLAFTQSRIILGEPAYSPIVHCHEMTRSGYMPGHFEFWRDYNFKMIDASSKLYVLCLPGWKISVGVTAEISYARAMNKHTVYWSEDGRFFRFREDEEWQQ